MIDNVKAILFGLFMGLILGELSLRLSGSYRTWTEINLGYYDSGYEAPPDQGWYLTWPPNVEYYSNREEFNYK